MPQVLTLEGAAPRLKLKPQTIREWLKAGKFKGVKLGRVWRVDAEALDRLFTGDEDREDPWPRGTERLRSPQGGFRLWVGDYRILYDVDDTQQVVRALKSR